MSGVEGNHALAHGLQQIGNTTAADKRVGRRVEIQAQQNTMDPWQKPVLRSPALFFQAWGLGSNGTKLRVLVILVRLARGRDQTAKFSFLAFKMFCSNLLSPKGWSNELRSSVFLPQRNRSEAEV
jgi:hypothetical protein